MLNDFAAHNCITISTVLRTRLCFAFPSPPKPVLYVPFVRGLESINIIGSIISLPPSTPNSRFYQSFESHKKSRFSTQSHQPFAVFRSVFRGRNFFGLLLLPFWFFFKRARWVSSLSGSWNFLSLFDGEFSLFRLCDVWCWNLLWRLL